MFNRPSLMFLLYYYGKRNHFLYFRKSLSECGSCCTPDSSHCAADWTYQCNRHSDAGSPGKEKLVVYSTCAGAAVDVVLNALLIPRFRCFGAAAGTLAAEITVLLVQLWYIRTWFPYFKGALPIKKVLIALIPSCFLLIALCQFLHTSTFFMLCATSLAFFTVYGGCLLLLKCRLSP